MNNRAAILRHLILPVIHTDISCAGPLLDTINSPAIRSYTSCKYFDDTCMYTNTNIMAK